MVKSLAHNGVEAFYSIEGSGPALVFLHGFLEDHTIWDFYVESLSKSFCIIAPDLYGHGKTLSVAEVHTMEMQAYLLDSILNAEKIDKAVIIGHSMGGYIALAYAEEFPAKVAGISLYNSTAYADDDQKKHDRLRSIDIVRRDVRHYTTTLVPGLFAPSNLERLSGKVEMLRDLAAATPVDGICAALRGMSARKDRTDVLSRAEYPVQLVIGREDKILPFLKHITIAGFPEKIFIVSIENMGHVGFAEAPEFILGAMMDFLKACYR